MTARHLTVLLLAAVAVGCGGDRRASIKQYDMTGMVLAVHASTQELTIKHDDIVGYMPGMTMNFPVVGSSLMVGREPGELIKATLEVDDLKVRLTSITHVGMGTIPTDTNAIAMAGGVLEPGDPMPDVALIDQDDRRRSLAEWRGTPVLVTFIYTRCPLPNYCPLMDRNFVTIQRLVAADPQLQGQLTLISVSFDPDYDTPAVLTAHAKTIGADLATWTLLTGDRPTVDKLAARFGVGVLRGPDGATEITHNLRTALFAADGTLLTMYPGSDWTPRGVIDDLRAHLAR
ncbi:MAG: electron transporter [Acidimicrobiia bacterium]